MQVSSSGDGGCPLSPVPVFPSLLVLHYGERAVLLLPPLPLTAFSSLLRGRVVAFASSRSPISSITRAPGGPAAPVPVHSIWKTGTSTHRSQCSPENWGFEARPTWLPCILAGGSFAAYHRLVVRIRRNSLCKVADTSSVFTFLFPQGE